MRRPAVVVSLLAVMALQMAPLVSWSNATSSADAAALEECDQILAIWARGSRQKIAEGEATKWKAALEERLAGVDIAFYELGADPENPDGYPAVAVGGDAGGFLNALGADASMGEAFAYGASVDKGADELVEKVESTLSACSETRFVLGGYSQGAQVVGEANLMMPPEHRAAVIFNALFGDPKLRLDEGFGAFPPACRGENFSPWRRVVPNCETSAGSLGARFPSYLPEDWESKTGLWCNDGDFICGAGGNITDASPHGTYDEAGAAIDLAAREITIRVLADVPNVQPSDVTGGPVMIGEGTTGLDVVLVVDTTGSMRLRLAEAMEFAESISEEIISARGRIGLVEYRDKGDKFVAENRLALTNDVEALKLALGSLYASGGGDTPEATLTALMTAFDTMDWRTGARKAAIVLTDAGFHDPDKAEGWTVDNVVERSIEIDPVNVYVVAPGYRASAYAELSDRTSGQFIVNDDSSKTSAALGEALRRIMRRPTVMLPLTKYSSAPGVPIQFDASSSYSPSGSLEKFEWDMDGDGRFELRTIEPYLSHIYASEFTGFMQVRATDSMGLVATHSVPVSVSAVQNNDGGLPAPAELFVTGSQTDDALQVSWSAVQGETNGYAIVVNDAPLGRTANGVTSIRLTGLQDESQIRVMVRAIDANFQLGHPRETDWEASAEPGEGLGLIIANALNLSIADNVAVTGGLMHWGDLVCSASGSITGDVTISGNLRAANNCRIDGNATVLGGVLVEGNSYISGNLTALDDVQIRRTARIGGNVISRVAVTSPDLLSTDQMIARGVVGGDILIDPELIVSGPVAPMRPPGFASDLPESQRRTWAEFLNVSAERSDDEASSTGDVAPTECLLGPLTDNGAVEVTVEEDMWVDARQPVSGCSMVTFQGVTVSLQADFTIRATSFASINRMRVVSADGEPHRFALITDAGNYNCGTLGSINLSSATRISPIIAARYEASGRVVLNGSTRLNGSVRAACLVAHGDVQIGLAAE